MWAKAKRVGSFKGPTANMVAKLTPSFHLNVATEFAPTFNGTHK